MPNTVEETVNIKMKNEEQYELFIIQLLHYRS